MMQAMCSTILRALSIAALGALAATAQAATFDLPAENEHVVGQVQEITARHEDTLVAIARGHNIGYREIRIANPGVDPWLPGENTSVVIPTRFVLPEAPRRGIVINVPEMRLYYYPKPTQGEQPKVVTYPISVGRQDWKTPLGLTRLVRKEKDPVWYPPASIRAEHAADGRALDKVVPPGPDNPLGEYALRLALPGYLIHGTNKPSGVGMQVTHGCMRLLPEDIEALYQAVPVGTPVRIVDQPYKAGWQEGELYLEVHPPLEDTGDQPQDLTAVIETLVAATRDNTDIVVNWAKAARLASAPHGIPERVSEDAEHELSAMADSSGERQTTGPVAAN